MFFMYLVGAVNLPLVLSLGEIPVPEIAYFIEMIISSPLPVVYLTLGFGAFGLLGLIIAKFLMRFLNDWRGLVLTYNGEFGSEETVLKPWIVVSSTGASSRIGKRLQGYEVDLLHWSKSVAVSCQWKRGLEDKLVLIGDRHLTTEAKIHASKLRRELVELTACEKIKWQLCAKSAWLESGDLKYQSFPCSGIESSSKE
ncbi:hypothetical protein Salat_0861700 [Sesamum alatum]|uniref:Uncharacterized protein n=1 Tax=Sesamum alatum TaxID=300844 RepID=A0AAE2CQQ4_9LAMI|nr:hypothetical protein Salat_0861700 [Sesamum alatum]